MAAEDAVGRDAALRTSCRTEIPTPGTPQQGGRAVYCDGGFIPSTDVCMEEARGWLLPYPYIYDAAAPQHPERARDTCQSHRQHQAALKLHGA